MEGCVIIFKNVPILNKQATIEAREKIGADLKSFEILEFCLNFNAYLTIFRSNEIYLVILATDF
jgi:hypothetical protein